MNKLLKFLADWGEKVYEYRQEQGIGFPFSIDYNMESLQTPDKPKTRQDKADHVKELTSLEAHN
jgi:hypothetical protein